MSWSNWKLWLVIAVVVIGLFAIYTFAAPGLVIRNLEEPETPKRPERTAAAQLPPSGVERIHTEWLERQSASFRSERNLFAFVEPPAPPAPPPPPPPAPPPDKDKDGIPDYQDNCPAVANPDQRDIDRNGVGAACQADVEIAPPPPPPPLPAFNYKYLGTFGPDSKKIAVLASGDEVLNVRVGQTFGKRFVLRSIGIESVEIGYVGFPPNQVTRIPVGQ